MMMSSELDSHAALLTAAPTMIHSQTLSWPSHASVSNVDNNDSNTCSKRQQSVLRSTMDHSRITSSTLYGRPESNNCQAVESNSCVRKQSEGLAAKPLSKERTEEAPTTRKRRARQIKFKVKPNSFVCESLGCGKVFSRAYNLTSHMKTHSEDRPFLCDSCPLAFARRHDRERHVRLHTGEKPYSCQSCGSGFMRNDALHRHQRICGQSNAALIALLQQQQQQRLLDKF